MYLRLEQGRIEYCEIFSKVVFPGFKCCSDNCVLFISNGRLLLLDMFVCFLTTHMKTINSTTLLSFRLRNNGKL